MPFFSPNTDVGEVALAPFRLDPTFVAQYADRRPPFGFNGLGELVYLRTYSRIKPDGTNERWHETVERVVNGTYNMQRRWIAHEGKYWNESQAQRSAQEMYDRIWNMKFLPPGRGLWAMGSPLTEERNLFAALNNCAFVSTAQLKSDLAEPFCFLMDASMLGIGVGFDTLGAGQATVYGPAPHIISSLVYTIPDTREGWVESLRILLTQYLQPNQPYIAFDYSEIRPAGSPIRGFGGVSAGPEPLQEMHEAIRQVLDMPLDFEQRGRPITSRDIVDIMNLIGKCVVAGNVRRTAEIAFGLPDDEQYLDLKNYQQNPEREAFGWTSNNSVFAELGMDYTKAAERIRINGEPGFAWLENMRQYGRMGDPRNMKDWRVQGGNPCLEQSLESYELCCLVETFPANHESLEDYKRTLKCAYFYAKTVTLGGTPWAKTNAVMKRNRRIGCSMSGVVQAIAKLGMHEFRTWCEEGYQTIQRWDRVYSEWFGIPMSVKTTSIKPSGTVSLLAGATPGMHYPEARTYIRRMRLSKWSELVEPLRRAGYRIEPAFGSEDSTLVVEFPVKIVENVRIASEVSMWEQLELAALLQEIWADNQVSCTVTFKPGLTQAEWNEYTELYAMNRHDPLSMEETWRLADLATASAEDESGQIAAALEHYQYRLKGISFLPRKPAGAYRQMPYEAITESRYREEAARLMPVDFSPVQHELAEAERFCNNDTCEIK